MHCTEEPIFHTTISTNMRRHLESQHEIILPIPQSRIELEATAQLRQLYLGAKRDGSNTDAFDTLVFKEYLNQEVIDEALVQTLQ